jgi:ribonuclease G
LVEMTRQNVTEGVREILTKTCPVCGGEGVVLSEETVAIDVERKLRDLATEKADVEAFLIQINPRVTQLLARGPGRPLLDLERDTGKHFHFEGSEGLPTDHFAVTLEGTRSEVEDRALPFREGEEVLVQINEPHMYAEDDAVAKIDGYVIAVAGAGPYIGEKRLVRIESVGRTAASGVLADAPVNGAEKKRPPAASSSAAAPVSAPSGDSGSDSDDGDEDRPKSRRRGRRGGRGRSKAGAAAEASEGGSS